MKKYKAAIYSVAVIGLLLAFGVFSAQASASSPAGYLANVDGARDAACGGIELTGGNCDPDAAETAVGGIVRTVINIFSMIVAVVAVIMIIIGGLKYITSSGDSNNVNSAKNTILYAVIGLVIVALAQVIVRFVLNRVAT